MPSYRCERCGTPLETDKRPGEAEVCPACLCLNVVPQSAFARFVRSLRERRLWKQAKREQAQREREAKARLAHAAEPTVEPDQQEPPPAARIDGFREARRSEVAMKLNKRQRLALCMGGLFIVGMLLFPPWLETSNSLQRSRYSFVASPPTWVWTSDFLAWADGQSRKLMGLIVEQQLVPNQARSLN